jgi:hypothetical protein
MHLSTNDVSALAPHMPIGRAARDGTSVIRADIRSG